MASPHFLSIKSIVFFSLLHFSGINFSLYKPEIISFSFSCFKPQMEKEISSTGHVDTSSSSVGSNLSYSNFFRSSSSSSFLNYRTNGEGFTTYKPLDQLEMMMMTSRSPHSEQLMDLHHHQDLMDRHNTVLRYLKETAKQAQALRQENVNLKMVNDDLTSRLSLLLRATSDYASLFGFTGTDPNSDLDTALSGLGMMSLGEGQGRDDVATEGGSPSPTSVMDTGRAEGNRETGNKGVILPKSISVRSRGYLKHVPAGGSSGEQRVNKQKVYVRGGEKEKEPLELEVYNQGYVKTELCNKWQETGGCPYGEQCQFAHGVEELRPVLRHPRYKTEVCRMVLSGDHCPYGHRCHFRHTLTDQEELIRSTNLRSLKYLNR